MITGGRRNGAASGRARIANISDGAAPAAGEAPARTFTLTHDERARSRLALMGDDGVAIGLALPRGTVLHDGDWIATDSGHAAQVVAAVQPLARVTASSPVALLRAVYHLANRHVAAQIAADHVLIERDPVLEHMLEHLGAAVAHLAAAFAPESGAYEGDAHCEHGHQHHGEPDPVSASVSEALSIAAHERRGAAGA